MFQIVLRSDETRFRCKKFRPARIQRAPGRLHGVFGRRIFHIKLIGPLVIALRINKARLDFGKLRLRILDRRCVTDVIELIEHLPFLHKITIVESDFDEVRRNSRRKVYAGYVFGKTDHFAGFNILLFENFADLHFLFDLFPAPSLCIGRGKQTECDNHKNKFFH